jgi:hypothetical protein
MKRKSIPKPAFSPCSQRSRLKLFELEAEREKVRSVIGFAEKRIAEGKKRQQTQVKTVIGGTFAINAALSRTLADIEDREREIRAYQEHDAGLEAEISALENPPAAQLAERTKRQHNLAQLVRKRLEVDVLVDGLVQALKPVLDGRAAITARILEAAAQLDFSPDVDFDAARFAALAQALPAELTITSEKWVGAFLGEDLDRKPYTIGSVTAVLPETLASANVFRPGETAMLTAEQAAKLPSESTRKGLPTPQEMEESVRSVDGKPTEDDSFPVSGFIPR